MNVSASALDLPPVAHAAGTIALPRPKSISNRVLLLARLRKRHDARGLPLDADDVDRMLDALAALGVRVDRGPRRGNCRPRDRRAPFPRGIASLFLGNAGTAFPPAEAAVAFAHGHELAGVARMHEQAIGDLVDAARARCRHPLSGRYRISAAGDQVPAPRPGRNSGRVSACAATCRASSCRALMALPMRTACPSAVSAWTSSATSLRNLT
jgi:hypothetical protein